MGKLSKFRETPIIVTVTIRDMEFKVKKMSTPELMLWANAKGYLKEIPTQVSHKDKSVFEAMNDHWEELSMHLLEKNIIDPEITTEIGHPDKLNLIELTPEEALELIKAAHPFFLAGEQLATTPKQPSR